MELIKKKSTLGYNPVFFFNLIDYICCVFNCLFKNIEVFMKKLVFLCFIILLISQLVHCGVSEDAREPEECMTDKCCVKNKFGQLTYHCVKRSVLCETECKYSFEHNNSNDPNSGDNDMNDVLCYRGTDDVGMECIIINGRGDSQCTDYSFQDCSCMTHPSVTDPCLKSGCNAQCEKYRQEMGLTGTCTTESSYRVLFR